MTWLLVGLGGALGSMARYGVNQAAALWLPTGFPFGTFLVNAIGCAIFGALAGQLSYDPDRFDDVDPAINELFGVG